MSTKYMVFQSGYVAFGFGDDPREAVEDANSNLEPENKIYFYDIECADCVKSEVDGQMYWTNNPEIISQY